MSPRFQAAAWSSMTFRIPASVLFGWANVGADERRKSIIARNLYLIVLILTQRRKGRKVPNIPGGLCVLYVKKQCRSVFRLGRVIRRLGRYVSLLRVGQGDTHLGQRFGIERPGG